MVRIVSVFVLVFIEELCAESETSSEEDLHMKVRSLGTVDKSQPSLISKEDAELEEELLRHSDELGVTDWNRQPRLSRNRFNSSSIEFDFSKELRDYHRSSLLSEASVLRRRVRSQAARRKRLENQSRKSNLEHTRKTPKYEKEDEISPEKEEDVIPARSERERSHEEPEDDEEAMEEKHSNLSEGE